MPQIDAGDSVKCEKCEKCGGQMKLRSGKFGQFYGCSGFPKCRNTKPFNGKVQRPIEVKPNNNIEWSEYQQAIFALAADLTTWQHLVIEAGAGSGKTTVGVEFAARLPKDLEIAFVAFNVKIARTFAAKLPANVHASTLHSLGLGNAKNALGNVKVEGRKVYYIIKDLTDQMPFDRAEVVDQSVSSITRLVSLCKANLMDPTDANLDYIADRWNVETNGDKDIIYETTREAYRLSVEDTKTIDFDDMIHLSSTGRVPCKQFDILVIDETQDLNKANLEFVVRSVKPDGHIVAVGDTNQCVVDNTWISCYNEPMLVQDIIQGQEVLVGGGGGKLDTAAVNEVYRREVKDLPVYTVKTKSGYELTTTPEHIYFAGYTPDQLQEDWHFVYLMYKKELGYRVGVTRIGRSSVKTLGYMVRSAQERADKMWILRKCDSEAEARYWEQFYSVKFGLPTWLFYSGGGRYTAYDDTMIERLFHSLDTREGAESLLKSLDMSPQYPHHTPKSTSKRRRRNFSITLCADSRYKPLHHYAISGSSSKDRAALEGIGIEIRTAKKSKGWRIEGLTSNLSEIYELLKKIESVIEVNIIEKARLGNRALPFTPASHVRQGMKVFVNSGDGTVAEDEVVSVERHLYTGTVHDLNIDRYHNYAANGILTHNSIYGFRGADTDAMPNIIARLNAKVLPLSITYRVPLSGVALANTLVPELEAAPNAKEGILESVSEYRFLDMVRAGDLVLCRTNAPLVKPCFDLIRQGRKAVILGRDIGSGLIVLVQKIQKRERVRALGDTLEALNEYRRQEISKLMRAGKEMAADSLDDKIETIFALSDGCHTVADLERRIKDVFRDDAEGVTFSTVHKSKGGEADRVFILKPELMPHPKATAPWELAQERNCIYVSLTRHKEALYFVR